jgi:hypothetical protein
VTLAWDDVSNETGYKIYEWNGITFVYLASVGIDVTTFTDNRGTCGWDEYYEVSAYNSIGESVHANWIHGYTLPCTPSQSIPENGSSKLYNYDLTYQWNTVAGATEYQIEWWGGPYSKTQPCGWSSSTSCHIGGVAEGNTYSWHVKARNSAGESPWSGTWTFTIQRNLVPDLVIQSITASPSNPIGNQQVTFTIRVKNQGTGNVTSSFYVDFYIDRQPLTDCSDSGTAWWTVDSLAAGATQDLTYIYDGFSSSGVHNLYASADTNCYISESSNNNNIRGPVVLNVQPIPPPPAPTLSNPANGSSNPYDYDLNFQWNTSSGATEYLIEWWGGPYTNMQSCGWSNSTSCYVGVVIAGNTYSWHVKARNSGGESPWSSTRTFMIRPQTFNLALTTAGTGSGTVTSNPAGIHCGSTCSYEFNANTEVTLTATATAGSIFTGWNGAGCTGRGTCKVTMTAAKSISANFKKKGADTTGVFRPTNGLLYLKNQNTTGFADLALNYGIGGDYPVVGDWDGNGTVTIGIYRNGYFYLRNSNTIGFAEVVFPFGNPGDQAIAGDWNGDDIDTIGVFRPSTGQFLLRNSNTEGAAEMSFYLGNVGDVGIAGDWNGDGMDTTGVFRPSNGIIYLKNTNETGFADAALNYGLPGDKPVTGDWDNDGIDTIGVYRNGQFYLRNENTIGFAEIIFGLGNPGDIPIAGNWDGQP